MFTGSFGAQVHSQTPFASAFGDLCVEHLWVLEVVIAIDLPPFQPAIDAHFGNRFARGLDEP